MVFLNKNVINNSNFMERRCGLHQGAESEITGLETLNDDHITGREVQRSAHLRQSVSVLYVHFFIRHKMAHQILPLVNPLTFTITHQPKSSFIDQCFDFFKKLLSTWPSGCPWGVRRQHVLTPNSSNTAASSVALSFKWWCTTYSSNISPGSEWLHGQVRKTT